VLPAWPSAASAEPWPRDAVGLDAAVVEAYCGLVVVDSYFPLQSCVDPCTNYYHRYCGLSTMGSTSMGPC